MSTLTPILKLIKHGDNDNVRQGETIDASANMDIIDALFDPATGHKHDGVDSPVVDIAGLPKSVPTMVSITTAESPYTVPGWIYHVKVDASSGNITVNLPTAVGHEGESIDVIKIDDSINKVTIVAYGSEMIDYPPLPTYVLLSQGDTVTLRSDDANVLVV
jgi:hypothetical protein